MKRLFTEVLALVMLISLAACSGGVSDLPMPTEQLAAETAEPTAEPTAAPTEAPTPEPTAEPYYVPYEVALGRLTDGPFLPEGAEYVVIKGESDIYYVYNSMGELEYSFHAIDDENEYSGVGIFGPKGVTCGRLISTGEKIGDPNFLGDIIFMDEYYEVNDGEEYYRHGITKVYNSELEPMCEFEQGEATIGRIGGILHVDGKLLVLDRSIEWENFSLIYGSAPKLFTESGEFIRELDPEPFGYIVGVLGNKYIIGYGDGSELLDIDSIRDPIFNIYTLDGQRVMENVALDGYNSGFCGDSEMWVGILYCFNYAVTEDGVYYDGDLNEMEGEPDMSEDYGALARAYRALDLEDAVYSAGNVYAGVKDKDGNWLFRIYNPGNASDSDNSEGDRFWRIYGKWSVLQNTWWD